MSNQTNDLYEILGVTKDASQDEIKSAFREGAKKYHPDKKGGDEERFKEINAAYKVLGDGDKRKNYDEVGIGNIYGVSNNSATNRTETAGAGTKTAETKSNPSSTARTYTKHHVYSEYSDYFDGGMGYSKTVSGYREEQKKHDYFVPKDLGKVTTTEIISTYGTLQIDEAELELMAGYMEALNTKGPFVAESGSYRVTKTEDENGIPGQIKIEVRLGRFDKSSEGDIKLRKGDGWGYEVKQPEDFVDIADVKDSFAIIGIVKPLGYEGYVNKLTEMAGNIAAGRIIDGREIVDLDTTGRMCFLGQEGKINVQAKNLKTELDNRVNEWKIKAPEGSIFNHKEGARVPSERTRV